jgi:hypothetical protein
LSVPGDDLDYGGVECGLVKQVVLTSKGRPPFRVENESLGEPTDILNPPKDYAVSFFLRGWDDDAVEQFLTDGTNAAGGTSLHRGFEIPGATVPGASALGRALVLMFVPDDVLHVPTLLVYRAIPYWTIGAEMAWQHESELGIPISCECMRDANLNTLAIKMMADLSLT